jgi:hypothetical protein
MRRGRPVSCSSSNTDESDPDSCFDPDDIETDFVSVIDADSDIKIHVEDELDNSWIAEEEDHPPDYYLNQEEECDEAEDANQDYKDNSILLLDGIEARWNW